MPGIKGKGGGGNLEGLHPLQGLVASTFLEKMGWRTGAPLLPMGMSPSESGNLSHGRGGLMEHIHNPPLERKGSSYQERLYLENTVYAVRSCCSMTVYLVSALPELEPKS